MPDVNLNAADAAEAAELAETLQFPSEWLARDAGRLSGSLAQVADHPRLRPPELRANLERFACLLAGSDGEQLFGP